MIIVLARAIYQFQFRAVPFNMLWEGRVTKPKKDGGSGVVKKLFSKMETGGGVQISGF